MRPHKDQLTIHLGSRTYYHNECNLRRDGESTHLKILQSEAENCSTNRCQLQGLGACPLQDGHPIYFVSKSLTDAEKGYVAIELEAFAVSWACEKFHHFLYGSHFTLQMDQKPLESILACSLNEATPRLQRLLIKASAYDFNFEYIPGPKNQVADCPSQLGCIKDNIVLPKLRVNAITQQLSNPDDVIQDIRLETRRTRLD